MFKPVDTTRFSSKHRLFHFQSFAIALTTCLMFVMGTQIVLSQEEADSNSAPLQYERDLTTEEIVTKREGKADTLIFPGTPRILFSPDQDMLYQMMIELQIDPHSRFAIAAQESAEEWLLPTGSEGQDIWMLAERYLNLPPDVFAPTPEMLVQHDLMMSRSADLGNIGLPRATNMAGLQIPLTAIGAILGFTKDVSATIRYTVPFRSHVSIVIYSPQAQIIMTLLDQQLDPGTYESTWNGRDKDGKPMPAGDYIGEVRIGKTAVMRKYIQLR